MQKYSPIYYLSNGSKYIIFSPLFNKLYLIYRYVTYNNPSLLCDDPVGTSTTSICLVLPTPTTESLPPLLSSGVYHLDRNHVTAHNEPQSSLYRQPATRGRRVTRARHVINHP